MKLEKKTDFFGKAAYGLNSDALNLSLLRSALCPVPTHTVFVQEGEVSDDDLVPASVLFGIVLRENGPSVLLTQRTAHLKDHAGQISFPGGRAEPQDASPADTALRETQEEIGLSSSHIEIIGYLPEYCTSTGFRITPVVAVITPPFELSPDSFEVAEVFEVPLSFLLNLANHQQHTAYHHGKLRHYTAMPYGEYFIWGVTAGIIVTLAEALSGLSDVIPIAARTG